MATNPIDTAKLYALTSAGACSATLTQGETSITWEALSEGGQTSIIVPAGATLSISDPTALLSPLPANFKAALGAAKGSAGGEHIAGESITPAICDAEHHCHVAMGNATWHILPAPTANCTIAASTNIERAFSMQLLFTPADDMNPGWLRVADSPLIWLYGEPVVLSGHTYIIGVTQIAPDKILANLLATF